MDEETVLKCVVNEKGLIVIHLHLSNIGTDNEQMIL